MPDPTATSIARQACLPAIAAAMLLVTLLGASTPTLADDYEDAVARGKVLVQERCARCHAVGRDGESPFAEAPPFHEIVRRYRVEGLAEAFAEGITVGHPAMPEFVLPPDEITDLLTYLDDLTQ